MKLKNTFLTHEVDGEHIMVAVGDSEFSGLIRSNKTAAFIINALKEDVTIQQIVEKMSVNYDASIEVISHDVDLVINQLRGIGAIDE